MPTYDFRCPAGHGFERRFSRISDSPSEVECPECGAVAVRQISGGAGLLFKGSGFYITDYGKDGKKDQRTAASGGAAKGGEKSGGETSGGEKSGGEKGGDGGGAKSASAGPATSSTSSSTSSSGSSGGEKSGGSGSSGSSGSSSSKPSGE